VRFWNDPSACIEKSESMKFLVVILSILLSGFTFTGTKPAPADLVFIHGNVYTVNNRQPHAEAIAVRGDRIVYVGSNAGANKLVAPKTTRVVDLHGATVLPGMTDAHYHFIGVGQREMNLNLEGITSLEDFLAKVKARVDQTKPGDWVTGRGWIETFWQPPVFPTRWDLDKIAPNNPVFLTRADGHGAVANSAALKIGGVTKDTKDPFGGQVLRDKESGEPNGMLLDTAQGFVSRHIPARGDADTEQAIILANKRSIELGWTQVQDPGGSYRDIDFYEKLYAAGKLKIRVYKAVYGPGEEAQRLLSRGPIIALACARSKSCPTARSDRAARPCLHLTVTLPTAKGFCASRKQICSRCCKRRCAKESRLRRMRSATMRIVSCSTNTNEL
jgi:predicted amidohydrolase YtcJ